MTARPTVDLLIGEGSACRPPPRSLASGWVHLVHDDPGSDRAGANGGERQPCSIAQLGNVTQAPQSCGCGLDLRGSTQLSSAGVARFRTPRRTGRGRATATPERDKARYTPDDASRGVHGGRRSGRWDADHTGFGRRDRNIGGVGPVGPLGRAEASQPVSSQIP
jgi:hypothetical protein